MSTTTSTPAAESSSQTQMWLDHFVAYLPMIEANLDGTVTAEDIVEGIARGTYQMWTADSAIAVSQLFRHPQIKECQILLAAGDDKQLPHLVEHVAKWAATEGCGRVSVKHHMAGWEPTTICSKEL